MFNWFPYHLLLQKYPRKALYVSLRSAIWAVLKPSHCNFCVSILSLCHSSHSEPNVPIFRLSNCLIQGMECESMPINRIGSSNSWSRPSAARRGNLCCLVLCRSALASSNSQQVLAATQWFDLYVYITGSLVLTYILPGRGWKKTCQESYQAESGKGLGKWWKTFH